MATASSPRYTGRHENLSWFQRAVRSIVAGIVRLTGGR